MAAVLDMESVRHRRGGALSATAIDRAARERAAIALRRQGRCFEEIACELGFADRSGARKAVERGLSRWMRETDEEFRARELERSEMVIDRLWPLIDRDPPDLKALDRYIQVANYRAKITGLMNKRPAVPETYPGAPNRYAEEKADDVQAFRELSKKLAAGTVASGYGLEGVPEESDDLDPGEAAVAAPMDPVPDRVDDLEDDLELYEDGTWVDGKFVPSAVSDPDDGDRARPARSAGEPFGANGSILASAISMDRMTG
jgi:hypothetical protein